MSCTNSARGNFGDLRREYRGLTRTDLLTKLVIVGGFKENTQEVGEFVHARDEGFLLS